MWDSHWFLFHNESSAILVSKESAATAAGAAATATATWWQEREALASKGKSKPPSDIPLGYLDCYLKVLPTVWMGESYLID